MIDMPATFDIVDHGILLQRLSNNFDLRGPVHSSSSNTWVIEHSKPEFQYLSPLSQKLKYGVPQGPVIGPQVFTYYSHTIGQIISKHSIIYHI